MNDVRSMDFIILTPARNEEDYIEKTIKSVLRQKIKPVKWIIVDDNSMDNTYEIIKKYENKVDFIKGIKSRQSEKYNSGGKQIKILLDSIQKLGIDLNEYDYIVKLDADVVFKKNYFKNIFSEFQNDGKLGIASGVCYQNKKGKIVRDSQKKYKVLGASKVYRKECWEDINGLVPIRGWDSIDEITAQMNGWKTKNFNYPICHLEKRSNTDGILKRTFTSGLNGYIKKSFPPFIFLKSLKKMKKVPFLGLFLYLLGYFYGYLTNKKRYNNYKFNKFIIKREINIIKSEINKIL